MLRNPGGSGFGPSHKRRHVARVRESQAHMGALTDLLPEEVLRPVLTKVLANGSFRPPLLPAAARRVIDLTRKPDVSFDECEEALRQDAALVAEVLKVANSSFYRGRSPSRTLKDAFSRVGLSGLRDILLAAAVGRLLVVKSDPKLTERLRTRSMAVAVASRTMARSLRMDPDAGYLGGLIHDVGWSLVYGVAQIARRELPQELVGDPVAMRRAAMRLHSGFGARMARQWKLPDALVETIAYHHAPDKARVGVALAFLVAGAIRICDALGIHPDRKDRDLKRDPVMTRLKLTGRSLEKTMLAFQLDWGLEGQGS